jgi:hypothetical protein
MILLRGMGNASQAFKASEQCSALFARSKVIGRLQECSLIAETKERFRGCWRRLRVKEFQCCSSAANARKSVMKIVLLNMSRDGLALDLLKGRIVLLTASLLPSDNSLTPCPHPRYLPLTAAILLHFHIACFSHQQFLNAFNIYTQQHENPFRHSYVILSSTNKTRLRRTVLFLTINILTYSIPEGKLQQHNNLQGKTNGGVVRSR